MRIEDFHALKTGRVPQPDGHEATLTVHDLGTLQVPSGRLAACDPFVTLDSPLVTRIPAGSHPVRVTVADVSDEQDGSHMREAYLSVVLADGVATTVEPAESDGEGPPPIGEWYGVGVDAGTVAFVDADAVAPGMPEDTQTWYDEVFDSSRPDSWFNVMDADGPCPSGSANIVLPRAARGENLVLSHSGWGDGFYPLVLTRDAEGWVLGIHIDLLVVGSDEDPEEEAASVRTPAQDPSAGQPGLLARLFRR